MNENQTLVLPTAILTQLANPISDERRTIWERPLGSGRLQFFLIHKGDKPLGNHFHRQNEETFTFYTGGGTILTAPVNEEGIIVGPIVKHTITPGSSLEIPVNVTHRFDVSAGTFFNCVTSHPFDPNDMIPCPLPDPSEIE